MSPGAVLTDREVGLARLAAHGLVRPADAAPEDVVRGLGAVQAQDLPGALVSVGLRRAAGAAGLREAFDAGRIVRTWSMRGTLHLVPAEELREWLAVLGPRTVSGTAARRRELGVDERLDAARGTALAALRHGPQPRERLLAAWEDAGLLGMPGRGYHLVLALHLDATLCMGPLTPDGRDQLVAPVEQWVPGRHTPFEQTRAAGTPQGAESTGPEGAPDEIAPEGIAPEGIAKARRATEPTGSGNAPESTAARAAPGTEPPPVVVRWVRRYLRGHGPASVADAARWAALPKSTVRAALARIDDVVAVRDRAGRELWCAPEALEAPPGTARRAAGMFLLPGFDEFVLGYGDRSHVLAGEHAARIVPGGNGVFKPIVVAGGRIVGTWARRRRAGRDELALEPFEAFSPARLRAAERAFARLPVLR